MVLCTYIISLSQPLIAAGFSDVTGSHINIDAINYVEANGIVNGYPDGTFKPDDTINRAEFTKIVIESAFPNQASGSMCFPDVNDEWFAKYVCFAKNKNIIGGYPDGTFKPDQEVSFVEAAKIIVNTLEEQMTAEAGEAWYKPHANHLGSLSAIPTSVSSLEKKVTRGEIAEIIYRLMADVTNKDSLKLSDLDPSEPAEMEEEMPEEETNEEEMPEEEEAVCEDLCGDGECQEMVCLAVGCPCAETVESCPQDCSQPEPEPQPEPQPEVKTFNITAKKWEFIPSTITVKKGDTVRLNITSIDVDHGLAISAFNINETLKPNQTVTVEFVADQTGSFNMFCSVFCGSGHGEMSGTLVVE